MYTEMSAQIGQVEEEKSATRAAATSAGGRVHQGQRGEEGGTLRHQSGGAQAQAVHSNQVFAAVERYVVPSNKSGVNKKYGIKNKII